MSTWMPKEIEFLKLNYPEKGLDYCASHLGRSRGAVSNKARRLNLKREYNFRYNVPETPNGYEWCFSCKQILPDGSFYRKDKTGSYNRKSRKCRSCHQEQCRRHYRENKDDILREINSNPVKVMIKNAKHRAKKKGIPFNITEKDISIPNICPALGIPIIPFSSSENSPTIDRFVPEDGYVKGNVVVISRKANVMKNNANVEEVRRLLAWMESF